MPAPTRPTLRLLAKIAGVSATTASLALRGSHKISLSQRKHVVAVAARLGYAPDAKIAEFMAYMRTRRKTEAAEVLAYLRQTPDRQDGERSQAFEGYLPGAKRRAEELGYRLETFTIGPGELSRAAAQRIFHTRRIRGVILAPVADPHLQPGLDWSDLAVVRLGYTTAAPQTHRVAGNPYRNMARCLQKLRTMGYRRIGLGLSSYDSLRVEHQWRAAFADDWLHCRPANRVPFCNLSSEDLETWLQQGRPEVVVAVDASLRSRIEALGLGVPADVAFVKVGIEEDEDSLCGIVANFEAIGALAVEQLIGCMHRNEFGLPANPQTITVEGTWREGASCPALAGRRRPAR